MGVEEIQAPSFVSTSFEEIKTPSSQEGSSVSSGPKPAARDTIEMPAEEESCCLMRCFICFFNWLCSFWSFTPTLEEEVPATKQEKQALVRELREMAVSVMEAVRKRYSRSELNYTPELAPCILADSLNMFSFVKKMQSICESLVQKMDMDEETTPLTKREIQLGKKEMSEVVEKAIQFSKKSFDKTLSTEMQKRIDDFSLEELHFCDEPECHQACICFVFDKFSKTAVYLLGDVMKYVNKIRIDKPLPSISKY